MGVLVDREVLGSLLSADLEDVLKGSKCTCPISNSILAFKVQEQVRNLNRKADSGTVDDSLKEAAISKFLTIQEELACLELPETVRKVRDRLHEWLPPVEHIWEELWSGGRFGPGSVFHARDSAEKSLSHKIGGAQTVSPKAYWLAVDVLGTFFPGWCLTLRKPKIVRGNRLAHVSKDVRKCRQIAVEPSLNIFLQLAVGNWLTKWMKRRGIADLSTGQTLHRKLVRDYNTWGTIDLSDASDRISLKLVRAVLPPDWFELLDALRSHQYRLPDGTWGTYEGFSSQGNAFTFPLETMLFKAIALCSSEQAHVYGDDIIVPLGNAAQVASDLESFGLVVNVEKSFWGQHDGLLSHFRESCGEDTLFGEGVRSVFYKRDASHPADVCAIANMLYERWGLLPRVHGMLLDVLNKSTLLTGPRAYWSTNVENSLANSISVEYSSWLWEDILTDMGIETEDRWSYCPQYHARTLVLEFWSTETKKLAKSRRLSEVVRLMEFLYSGSTDSSPLSRPKKRLKTVTQFFSVGRWNDRDR